VSWLGTWWGKKSGKKRSGLAALLWLLPLGLLVFGFGFIGSLYLEGIVVGFIAIAVLSLMRRSYRLALLYGVDFGLGVLFGQLVVDHTSTAGLPIWLYGYSGGKRIAVATSLAAVGAALGCVATKMVRRSSSKPVQESSSKETNMRIISNAMCPYCLGRNTIATRIDGGQDHNFSCTECKESIPAEYVARRWNRRELISAVGFRGQGKTAYLSSLFYSLDDLARVWPKFYTFPVDEGSLEKVRANAASLAQGKLPDPTPILFPRPAIVGFLKMPKLGDRVFLFYDTAGEAYERASTVITYAKFVARSRTVIFFSSVVDLKNYGREMHNMLSSYVQGLMQLGGNPREQNLIVVLTKGDKLRQRLQKSEEYKQIWLYLHNGTPDQLGQRGVKSYITDMQKLSPLLKRYITDELRASDFVNFATDRFKSVEFSIISSLGSEPSPEGKMEVEVMPMRIMDPLLWVTYKSMNRLEKILL
jgi:hypothetical protein